MLGISCRIEAGRSFIGITSVALSALVDPAPAGVSDIGVVGSLRATPLTTSGGARCVSYPAAVAASVRSGAVAGFAVDINAWAGCRACVNSRALPGKTGGSAGMAGLAARERVLTGSGVDAGESVCHGRSQPIRTPEPSRTSASQPFRDKPERVGAATVVWAVSKVGVAPRCRC